MKPKSFKWLHLAKAMTDITLKDDSPIAIQCIYNILNITIQSYHEDAFTILPDLGSLVPTNSFAGQCKIPIMKHMLPIPNLQITCMINWNIIQFQQRPPHLAKD